MEFETNINIFFLSIRIIFLKFNYFIISIFFQRDFLTVYFRKSLEK